MALEKVINCTILNGQTKSEAIRTGYKSSLVALITPAALTGTTFTFEASVDGTTFAPVYNEATLYSLTVSTSRYIALNLSVFAGAQNIKVVSGSAEAGDRQIALVVREVY